MSHNDDAKHWYRSMTQEERDEYNRKRYERLKAQRAAKARAAGLPAMGDILVCKVCGKTFTCVKANQLFCSLRCRKHEENRRLRVKRHRPGVKCRICGKEVPPGRRNFCSDECQIRHKRELDAETKRRASAAKLAALQPKICVFCGKEFMPSNPARAPHQKYCSRECANHSRFYDTKAEWEAAKAARAAASEARRTRDNFGCNLAERNAVIKAQCGSRDELWAASQHWTPAQRKFAKARWEELHPSSFFTLSGKY